MSTITLVDVSDVTPQHKTFHCAIHDWDTNDKAEWIAHTCEAGHLEYGGTICAICGKILHVPKDKPIPTVLFRKNMATHTECREAAGLGLGGPQQ